MKKEEKIKPIVLLMEYYDIAPMELFEIINMVDTPYHINMAGTLINNKGEARNEMYNVILNEPHRFRRCRNYVR